MNRRSLLGATAALGLFASALTTSAETAAAADTATKRIMLYGDSNTWGFIPIKEGAPSTRYPADVRWPGVLQAKLGNGYEVAATASITPATRAPRRWACQSPCTARPAPPTAATPRAMFSTRSRA